MPRLFQESRSAHILGVVADSGLLTRLAHAADIDFLLVLSAGVYRQHGVIANAAYLPFFNSNDLTEKLFTDQILPRCGDLPILAGIVGHDPTCPIADRLQRWQNLGVAGVVNYPSVTYLDGTLRQIFEDQGATVASELDTLRMARAQNLLAVGYVGPDLAAAEAFARADLDALILTVGLTRDLPDVRLRQDRLQQAITQLHQLHAAVRKHNRTVPCLVFGGPITRAEELEQVFRQVPFDGFVGGSVFGRLPIESSVTATLRRFKAVSFHRDDEQAGFGPLIGATPVMTELFRLIERAAGFDVNVCIEGESGTGKELVATQIHRLSRRADGPLVTLNCGAIPDTLLEAELFGHEKGAFTGADRRRLGKFELANHGTLFLDEIGDLSPRGQVALLRALQQREIVRVGADAAIPIDNRILAASNIPLRRLVEQGKFRADLHYRLNTITLVVPPLRDRLDDIPLLVKPTLARIQAQMQRPHLDLNPAFHDKLRRHAWPGNVRELQHVLFQAALLEDGPFLEARQFEPQAPRLAAGAEGIDRRDRARQAIAQAHGNKSEAAKALGVARKTLYAWLRGE